MSWFSRKKPEPKTAAHVMSDMIQESEILKAEKAARQKKIQELKAEAICYPYWWDGKRQAERPPSEIMETKGTLCLMYSDGLTIAEPVVSRRWYGIYFPTSGNPTPPWLGKDVYALRVSQSYTINGDSIVISGDDRTATYSREGLRSCVVEWQE